jgi:aminoglycoside 6-adenylyltransferase
MNDTLAAMKGLEDRVVDWARAKDDIRIVLIVGSWARADHPADEWSDLDIGFTTMDPKRYLTSDAWLGEIDDVWLVYPDPVGVSRHVLFKGGLDAGLAPIPHSSVKLAVRYLPALRRMPVPGALRNPIERELASAAEYVGRGVRVLLDKDGLAERFFSLLPDVSAKPSAPSETQYANAVKQFWFEAVWTAKHLRRGELWREVRRARWSHERTATAHDGVAHAGAARLRGRHVAERPLLGGVGRPTRPGRSPRNIRPL